MIVDTFDVKFYVFYVERPYWGIHFDENNTDNWNYLNMTIYDF